jgi:hypothetical protein
MGYGYDARFVFRQRHLSFYRYVTVTVTDAGFVTLTVDQIKQQKVDINPPQADKL